MSGGLKRSMLRVRVANRRLVADKVVELTLVAASGEALPAWESGAHIDLHLKSGLVRQYSLMGSPSDLASWKVAVLLEPDGRGGSVEVHQLSEGDELEASSPRNHFQLKDATTYYLIAGGIGITPLIPMMEQLEARGAHWHLKYCGRTRSGMAYADALVELYPHRVELFCGSEGRRLDLAALPQEAGPDMHVYACGPTALLDALEEKAQHWPVDVLQVERFEPIAQPDDASDTVFTVKLCRSGVSVEVQPGQTVLDAVVGLGADVLMSCNEGTCGTCETQVVEGIPDHRDAVLSASERASNRTMMICVSRSLTKELVLDL